MKGRCKDWLHHGTDHFLRHATPDGGDSQGPESPFALRDIHPPQRDRMIGPRLQRAHQRQEVLLQIGCEPLDGLLVEPCRPAVPLDRLAGLVKRVEGDPPGARVHPVCVGKHLEHPCAPL